MKAFLVPGNGEDLKSRDYAAVLKMYKSLGYEPHFVPVKWNYRTIDDWVGQVKSQISEKEIQNSLLSGFSFGSMIAMGVAAQTNPKQLLLFSLSPYFKEDMPLEKKLEVWAGKRKMENFKRFSMNNLVLKIKCPTILFLGEKEKKKYPDMWHRSSEAHRRISKSRLILVDSTGHDVGASKYVGVIRKALK